MCKGHESLAKAAAGLAWRTGTLRNNPCKPKRAWALPHLGDATHATRICESDEKVLVYLFWYP